MAKKAAKKQADKPPEAKQVQVRVVIDSQPDLPTYYVNHIEVGRLEHDFFILGTQLPIKPSQAAITAAKESGQLHIDATVQILVPASMVDGIITALGTQKKLYDAKRKDAVPAMAKLNS